MGSRHLGGSRNGQDARCPSIHATGETPVVPVRPCGRAKWRLRRNGNYGIIQNARGKVSVCAKRRDDDEPDKREETSPCRGRGCVGAFACFASRSPLRRRRRHLPQRLLDAHERAAAPRRPLDVVRLRSEHPALHQLLGGGSTYDMWEKNDQYQDAWGKAWMDDATMEKAPGFALATDPVHGSPGNYFAYFRGSASRTG